MYMFLTCRKQNRYWMVVEYMYVQCTCIHGIINALINEKKCLVYEMYCFFFLAAYTICWLPYFTGAVLQHHGRIGKSSRTFLILYTLAPTNSLANPLVFLIFNFKMFRKKSTRKKNNTFQMSSKAERSTFLTNHIDHNRSCAIHSHEYA